LERPAPYQDRAEALRAATSGEPSAPGAGSGFVRRGPGARLSAPAPEPERPVQVEAPEDPRKRMFFPTGELLYEPYLAAQRQSRSGIKLQFPIGKGRHVAVENTLGFDRSVVRWRSDATPDRASEIQVEAAVFSRFDIHEHWDQDAADWRFGFPVVFREGDVAWKIHYYHTTSHLGDEFIARTGAKPIHYHLEEVALGISWDVTEGARLYGEGGIAVYTGDTTGNGRLQAGYEWVGRKWSGGLAPYFAVDLQARNDQRWNVGKTVAVGLAFGRSIRFGVEYYQGRDPQTQFKNDEVRYLSLGFAMDF
jgi:hypothetical protein